MGIIRPYTRILCQAFMEGATTRAFGYVAIKWKSLSEAGMEHICSWYSLRFNKRVEKGYSALPGVRAVPINSWAEFLQILSQLKKNAKEVELKKNKGEEAITAYETIVIDVADIAYDFCEKFILNREGVETVKDIPFGELAPIKAVMPF